MIDQLTLEGDIAGLRTLDMTSGLLGMQNEVKTFAGVNLDASRFRPVTVRGDFTHLPFKTEAFETVLFDPPHCIDSRNTLFGTFPQMGGLGPHLATFKYGAYHSMKELRESVRDGIREAYRILIPRGMMIFKWSNSEKPYSWADDTVKQASEGLFQKEAIRMIRSNAHTVNASFYIWYRKAA